MPHRPAILTFLSLLALLLSCGGPDKTFTLTIDPLTVPPSGIEFFLFSLPDAKGDDTLTPNECVGAGGCLITPLTTCASEFSASQSSFNVDLSHADFPPDLLHVVSACGVDVNGVPLAAWSGTIDMNSSLSEIELDPVLDPLLECSFEICVTP